MTGTVPPLSESAWRAEFDKYKTIPQFQQRNSAMTLDDFKTIFWWEWTHRLMGRVIGAAFLLPFLFFLARGWIGSLRGRLWGIFALGALQGAVGWWMVASGLADRLEVSQYRLATHLILACVIFVAVLWTALQLTGRRAIAVPPRLRAGALALLVLALFQVYLGALVAGLRAGLIYNTWPLIDGHLVPEASRLFHDVPWWRNLFENTLTVQFNHRMTAYLLLALALAHLVDVARTAPRALPLAAALAGAIVLQAALGIVTLLQQVPIGLALAHQAGAVIVLALATAAAQRISVNRSFAPIGVSAPAR